MAKAKSQVYRYPGTKPFEDSDNALFKGRDEDIQKLFDFVCIENTVVLFSRSGLGKSSLLNAGLHNKIINENRATPLFIRFGAFYKDTTVMPLQKLRDVINNENISEQSTLFTKLLIPENDDDYTLWYRFKSIQFNDPSRNSFVLIFDQFEELFTYPQTVIEQFKKELSELLNTKVPQKLRDSINEKRKVDPNFISKEEANLVFSPLDIRVLFAIRSDKLSLLNNLTNFFPTILKNCYELKPLSAAQARQAITFPAQLTERDFDSKPFFYEEEVLDYILNTLTESVETKALDIAAAKGEIETFQLQIVCKYAEDLVIEKGITTITKQDLGDINLIFENQYKNIIDKLSAQQQLPARIMMEEKLIVENIRVSMPEIALLNEGKEKGLTKDLIDHLINTHIIRRDQSGTIEISHDTLVAPILKAKKERQEKEELARLEAEREQEIKLQNENAAREKMELVRTRKRLSIVYGLLGLASIAIIASVFLYIRANKQTSIAHSLTLAAITTDQIDKNPTFSIRLAELLWNNSLSKPPSPEIQYIVSESFYKSQLNPTPFFEHNFQHTNEVNSAVFSPDGKKIVTACKDSTAKIWNAISGKFIAALKHHQSVLSAFFSANGKMIVTASTDSIASIWNAETGLKIRDLKGHKDEVNTAEFSPDGKKVVTASKDGNAKLWNAESGTWIADLAHDENVLSATFSPNSKKIVTASQDSTAAIWDATTGKLIHILIGHYADVNKAVFSPNNKKVVTVSDDFTAVIWDAVTGEILKSLVHNDKVNDVNFSPDGKKIVTSCDDHTAVVWDVETGNKKAVLEGHEDVVYSVKFSPDSKKIITASLDNTAKLWDAETGKKIADYLGHQNTIFSVFFSQDGKKIVTASNDGTAKIWDANSTKKTIDFKGHKSLVNCAVFTPDGKKILTVSADHTAILWNTETGENEMDFLGHQQSIVKVSLSPINSKMILTASFDSTARIWDASSGQKIADLKHQDIVNSGVFSNDGKRIVTVTSDSIIIWDAVSAKRIDNLNWYEDGVILAKYSPDDKKIITASLDNTVKIWNVDTKELLVDLKDIANYAEFSPDGKIIVTASNDYSIKLWNAISGENIAIIRGHRGIVHSAVFSPDGKIVVSASDDKTAKIWDVASGKMIANFRHQNVVNNANFSPDGKKVVTSSDDYTAKIWLTPEGIIEWLDKQKFYRLTEKDLKDLGIDFIKPKK